ncbi:hypothetical protein BDP27DRAFT_1417695 [Rhodocollybia butyracea]|uniref:F-box domain-containing protein n=1 Tax=Rhodocollybia butyracea TaxID=206335 RepID=A0A9P5Q0Q6_9AGAR|nr:hypothetical protein BDP27DRAFT_1417695 [Rhodocollybia butyracea]
MESLPNDLIGEILAYSPSLFTLFSTIIVSKSIYCAFRCYPGSIIYRVYLNIFGPGFPLLLKALRFSPLDLDSEDWDLLLAQALGTDVIHDLPMTRLEKVWIKHMCRELPQIEGFFSFKYIDRTSVSSQLSSQESHRFRHTLHRIMLYNGQFPIVHYPIEVFKRVSSEEEHDGESSEARDSLKVWEKEYLQLEQLKRRKFLSKFSTDELLEIHSVSTFLKDFVLATLRWQWEDRDYENMASLALALGPSTIMSCFYYQSDSMLKREVKDIYWMANYHPLVKNYLCGPLLQVLDERQIMPPPTNHYTFWHSISLRAYREDGYCYHCGEELGYSTWTRTSWDPLRLIPVNRRPMFGYSEFLEMFKGGVRDNDFETRWLRQFMQPGRNYLTRMVGDIYESGLKNSAFANWTQDDHLCKNCFASFLREHLHIWLTHYKASIGELKDDCPYVLSSKI